MDVVLRIPAALGERTADNIRTLGFAHSTFSGKFSTSRMNGTQVLLLTCDNMLEILPHGTSRVS